MVGALLDMARCLYPMVLETQCLFSLFEIQPMQQLEEPGGEQHFFDGEEELHND